MNNLKEAAKGEDADAIKKAIENLGTTSQELGKILYEDAAKKQAASAGVADTPPGPEAADSTDAAQDASHKKSDDVIDVEFEAK